MKVADQNQHTIEYLLAQPKKQEDAAGNVKMIAPNGEDAGMGAEEDESMGDGEEWIGLD
jgi:periodic tryptophan protein 2